MSVFYYMTTIYYLLRTSKRTMGFLIGYIILNKQNALPPTPSPSQVYILIVIFQLDMFDTGFNPFI